MRMKPIAIAAFFVASLGAAPQTQSQVFDFTNTPTPQGLQEIATILRTVGNIQQLFIDSASSSLTVSGTTDELAMTGWIVHQLDQPVTDPPIATASPLQYLVAGKSDDVIRVFHLANIGPKPPQGIQEILTVLRTVGDVQKIFNYSALADLVVRGPASQIALSEYLIKSLDVVPGSVTTSQAFQFQTPSQGSQTARVFYLATMKAPQQIQEILTTLRTVADIQKVFNFTPLNALAIRGTADDIATSEWIIHSLDITASAEAGFSAGVREYIMPKNWPDGGVIRVFYPAHINTPQQLQQTMTAIRTKLQIQKIFNYSAPQLAPPHSPAWVALVVRGTADQITKTEQLILDQDQVAKATP
jgi:type II secretory pathway component GspD/PulD (secretin)